MKVRMASEKDIERIHELLSQVSTSCCRRSPWSITGDAPICSNMVSESIQTNSCGRS